MASAEAEEEEEEAGEVEERSVTDWVVDEGTEAKRAAGGREQQELPRQDAISAVLTTPGFGSEADMLAARRVYVASAADSEN